MGFPSMRNLIDAHLDPLAQIRHAKGQYDYSWSRGTYDDWEEERFSNRVPIEAAPQSRYLAMVIRENNPRTPHDKLTDKNRGYRILRREGWSPDTGLGGVFIGPTEPLLFSGGNVLSCYIKVKNDRKGLCVRSLGERFTNIVSYSGTLSRKKNEIWADAWHEPIEDEEIDSGDDWDKLYSTDDEESVQDDATSSTNPEEEGEEILFTPGMATKPKKSKKKKKRTATFSVDTLKKNYVQFWGHGKPLEYEIDHEATNSLRRLLGLSGNGLLGVSNSESTVTTPTPTSASLRSTGSFTTFATTNSVAATTRTTSQIQPQDHIQENDHNHQQQHQQQQRANNPATTRSGVGDDRLAISNMLKHMLRIKE